MSHFFTQHIIMIGPSACGKSTVGSELSEKLSWAFFDADDFYSSEDIHRMTQGNLLSHTAYQQWLSNIQTHITKLHKRHISSILACSCLTQSHRKILSDMTTDGTINIIFIYLDIDLTQALKRTKKRKSCFVTKQLVKAQFEMWEPILEEEDITHFTIDARPKSISHIVDKCIEVISE